MAKPVIPKDITIEWPGGRLTRGYVGVGWLQQARDAGMNIPLGCGKGSCGACEIEVNGETVRACIATVPAEVTGRLVVEAFGDPFW